MIYQILYCTEFYLQHVKIDYIERGYFSNLFYCFFSIFSPFFTFLSFLSLFHAQSNPRMFCLMFLLSLIPFCTVSHQSGHVLFQSQSQTFLFDKRQLKLLKRNLQSAFTGKKFKFSSRCMCGGSLPVLQYRQTIQTQNKYVSSIKKRKTNTRKPRKDLSTRSLFIINFISTFETMFKYVILIMLVAVSCIEGAVIQNQIVANSQNYYESLYRNYIIETNRQKILQSNQQSLTFKLQVNKFIQYSQDEFEKLFLLTRVASSTQVVSPFKSQPGKNLIIQSNIKLNSTNIYGFTDLDIDWNRAGMVTAVKNQGGCGSCWAFAAVSDLESSYLLNGYRGSIDLSQQQLVDCSGSFYNFGCGGGWMTNAFAYIFKNPLTTQYNYPYVANAQTCKTVNGNFSLKNLRSYWQNKNCQLLVDILKSRPLTVAVSADAFYWGFYKSGVLNQCSGTINHGVVVTGVKKNATDDYWIVKNSWGSDWGQNGYLRIDRSQKEGNLCDICSYPQHSII